MLYFSKNNPNLSIPVNKLKVVASSYNPITCKAGETLASAHSGA